MNIQRYFLDWDAPAAEKTAGWLLAGTTPGVPVDLVDNLIIAPTLQAARRLRETLAIHCHKQNSALLSAMIVTPHYFFSRPPPEMKVANPTLIKTIWTEVLKSVETSMFSAFFPKPPAGSGRFKWALNTGEMIEQLRQELADGGYSIADVISMHGEKLEEPDRWSDLAKLEEMFLAKLHATGFVDACAAKMRMTEQPETMVQAERVVVACVPDPALLAVRAITKLAETRSVAVLVHAPESEKDKFDDWGRAIPDMWADSEIDIPEWDKNVFLESSPADQAGRVISLISELPDDLGPADISVGVPDPAVVPFLKHALSRAGLPAFDPSDVPFSSHALGRLTTCLFNLLSIPSYNHLAGLLRNPDFLVYLESVHNIPSSGLLTRLDEFQNRYLPATFGQMLACLRSETCSDNFELLEKALSIVEKHCDVFDGMPLEDAWRSFLKEVYHLKKINPTVPDDREFQEAASVVEQVLRETRDIQNPASLGDRFALNALFARRLMEQTFHRERGSEIIDLQGWLELPWTDTPFLVVTGFNDEFVPGGSLSDVFLPDSLRKILGIRDDRSRFGRDAYLLKTLVESRRGRGRLCVITGKATVAGEPLRPSRLLFRCPDHELASRAETLFKTIDRNRALPPSEIVFKLKPADAVKVKNTVENGVIHVTSFSDYLDCPFRFYLKHVLGMEILNDTKTELDALDFGEIVHKVLQAMGADKALWSSVDPDRLGKRLADMADQVAVARFGMPFPPAALIAMSSIRARLQAAARVQAALAADGWEVVGTELKKILKRKQFEIVGKIDRIDRHKKTGAIRIIDYKTSDNASPPFTEHLKTRRPEAREYNRFVASKGKKPSEKQWVNLQLPLYCLLYSNVGELQSDTRPAYFNLPKALSDTDISVWDDFDENTMISATNCIDGVLEDIAVRRFLPPSERVRYESDLEKLFAHPAAEAFDMQGVSS